MNHVVCNLLYLHKISEKYTKGIFNTAIFRKYKLPFSNEILIN